MSKTPMADEYPPCDYCEHRDKPPVAEPCIDCERESAGKWSKYVPIFKDPAWGDVLHYLSTHRLWGLARVVNDGMARIRELERELTAERERADREHEDAERYRWLQSEAKQVYMHPNAEIDNRMRWEFPVLIALTCINSQVSLNAAIDAARRK